jgi:hypothetical protein
MKNLRSAFKDVKKVGKLAIPLAIGEFARLGSTVVDAMFLVSKFYFYLVTQWLFLIHARSYFTLSLLGTHW